MSSVAFGWEGDDLPSPPPIFPRRSAPVAGGLPADVAAALWRGDQLGSPVLATCPSGWKELDDELPGAGWGRHGLNEVLTAQPSVLEWRLLAPALSSIAAAGKIIVIVGPPKRPHLPGLVQAGIDERHLVWIDVDVPAQRLWTTEQLVKGNAAGALLSWLPQARPEQIRRLQVAAQGCEGPVFLLRPEVARHEASAAPLRVLASVDVDWRLRLQILKRRGPVHDAPLLLPSMPAGLDDVLTPRGHRPSALISRREGAADVVGSASPAARRRRVATVS